MEAIFIVKFGNWFWKYNLFNLYHNPFSQVNIIIERSKYINEENHWQEKYSLKQSEITRRIQKAAKHTVWIVSLWGVILVRSFPHSDWIRRDTKYDLV